MLCVSLSISGGALAEPNSDARVHFSRGVEQAELGDFDSAASNFEEAYRLSPHYAVLYNLGQAYAALGKSLEAVRAFEGYLEGGGQKLPPERQNEVRQLILLSQRRIGYVAFDLNPPEAKLFVDGRAVDRSPRVPLSLLVGLHGIVLELPGYQTFAGSVNVESQKILPLAIKLEPASLGGPVAPAAGSAVGQVAIDSALPELSVSLDGASLEGVGKDPLLVPVGRHRVRCERTGYQPKEAQIDVAEKGLARVGCDLTQLPQLPTSELGFISFVISQPGAHVSIDGRRASANARLPKGTHSVRIQRSGFVDWTHTVTARPGFPETIGVQLKATPEHAQEVARRVKTQRSIAYVLGGTGIALLGTSAALYVSNNQRYEDWRAERDGVSRDIRAQTYPADLNARAADVRSTAVSIQRQDDAALGLAIAGGVLVGHAVVTWLLAR